MLYQFSFLPQVKRNVVVRIKRGTYELHYKLSNELRTRILQKYKGSRKSQNIMEL